MNYIATFDFGTTAVKGALVETGGRIRMMDSRNLNLIMRDGFVEQDPAEWIAAFREITGSFLREVSPGEIIGIIMSGQMQDAIFLDGENQPVGNAILYQDGRAREEYEQVIAALGTDRLESIIWNGYTPTLVAPKIAWVRKHQPEVYARTKAIVFSPKDLVNALLTDVCATDSTTASTVGAMNMLSKHWNGEILNVLGLDADLFPPVLPPHAKVGEVTPAAAAEFGFREGMPVFCGIGDAGSTFFASGIMNPGEFSVTWGTTGMVGVIADRPTKPLNGLWNLAAMVEDTYIQTVPFLNAGNVHKWISSVLTPGNRLETDGIDYAGVSALLDQPHSRSGLLCLPFLTGERFPVVDPDAKGCFIGLTPATTRADLVNACLEGVCFSVRQGMETMNLPCTKMILVGGAARVTQWCQKLADILETDVTVLQHSDALPSACIAAGALRSLGLVDSYGPFVKKIQQESGSVVYHPREDLRQYYRGCYEKYIRIYPAVKELFH